VNRKVYFRVYPEYPPLTRAEIRRFADALANRLADIVGSSERFALPEKLRTLLDDSWRLCRDVRRPAPSQSERFTDDEIRAACQQAAQTASSISAALDDAIEILQRSHRLEDTMSTTALKKRLKRIGRFVRSQRPNFRDVG